MWGDADVLFLIHYYLSKVFQKLPETETIRISLQV